MNDEIKEILDAWKNKKYILAYTFNYDSAREQNDKILDYITNLQQENERLKEDLIGQENLAITFSKTSHDYYQRIKKAVKYIENTPLYETTYDYNMEEELEIQNVSDETASNKLLDILNGKE